MVLRVVSGLVFGLRLRRRRRTIRGRLSVRFCVGFLLAFVGAFQSLQKLFEFGDLLTVASTRCERFPVFAHSERLAARHGDERFVLVRHAAVEIDSWFDHASGSKVNDLRVAFLGHFTGHESQHRIG